jgi:hypothetical protein
MIDHLYNYTNTEAEAYNFIGDFFYRIIYHPTIYRKYAIEVRINNDTNCVITSLCEGHPVGLSTHIVNQELKIFNILFRSLSVSKKDLGDINARNTAICIENLILFEGDNTVFRFLILLLIYNNWQTVSKIVRSINTEDFIESIDRFKEILDSLFEHGSSILYANIFKTNFANICHRSIVNLKRKYWVDIPQALSSNGIVASPGDVDVF